MLFSIKRISPFSGHTELQTLSHAGTPGKTGRSLFQATDSESGSQTVFQHQSLEKVLFPFADITDTITDILRIFTDITDTITDILRTFSEFFRTTSVIFPTNLRTAAEIHPDETIRFDKLRLRQFVFCRRLSDSQTVSSSRITFTSSFASSRIIFTSSLTSSTSLTLAQQAPQQ